MINISRCHRVPGRHRTGMMSLFVSGCVTHTHAHIVRSYSVTTVVTLLKEVFELVLFQNNYLRDVDSCQCKTHTASTEHAVDKILINLAVPASSAWPGTLTDKQRVDLLLPSFCNSQKDECECICARVCLSLRSGRALKTITDE